MRGGGGGTRTLAKKNVVGLFCGGAAFHDVVFAREPGCDVVRRYDWEVRMRKLACLFFPEEGVVKEMDIRAENIGALEADVGLAVPAADAWVHVNAGLPCCQDGRKGIFKLQGTQVLEKGFTPDGSGPGALTLLSSTGRLKDGQHAMTAKSTSQLQRPNDDSHSDSQSK